MTQPSDQLETFRAALGRDPIYGHGAPPRADESRPIFRDRVLVALVVGLLFGGICAWIVRPHGQNGGRSDFVAYWMAAHSILQGLDPYADLVRQHLPGLFAPITVALIAIPFAGMPAHVAAPVFFGMGCSVLAFAITKNGWNRLLVFGAAPVWHAVAVAQVAPLLVGASFFPIGWGLLTAKPNLAIPLVAMQATTRRAIIVGTVSVALILGIAFAMQRAWPVAWYHALQANAYGTQYKIPMMSAWGFVLWLPLLRWRRPEARLVFAMACMPQNFFFYEQLPLMLVARSRRELLLVAVASQVASILSGTVDRSGLSFLEFNAAEAPYVLVGLYLPAIALVLLRQNEGAVPSWLEPLLMRLPSSMRGTPARAAT